MVISIARAIAFCYGFLTPRRGKFMPDLDVIRNNVRKMLTAEFGTVKENDKGAFLIQNESSLTYVSFDDMERDKENVGMISVFSLVVMGLKEVNKDLAVELVTDMSRRWGVWFFVKRDDGLFNLIFQTSLIGATVDPVELKNAVYSVAFVSDEEDDKIVRKYGGEVYFTV